ncbi:MAG: TonB-dependent receptor [Chitinophagaceae bacterium]|nr:TonB-dependent receptor [Chitinophagaceae bacterium]
MRKLASLLVLLMVFTIHAVAQDKTVTGKVIDEKDRSPLIGASVTVKGTNTGTTTDGEGKFSLKVPPSARSLVISSVNYESVEVSIANRNVVNVVLVSSEKSLQEVVVVAYGQQSQKTKIQTVSVIKSDAFKNMPILSPTQALQGQAAGVNMTNSSGLLGAAPNVQIRGASSLLGGTQPLYVVDGVPLNDQVLSTAQGAPTGLNPLLDLNPNDIESISVLKDAAAVAIYGSRGTNGVVLIKTKRGINNQKTRLNLDYFTGYSRPTDLLDMMNADQFRGFVNEYRVARGQSPLTFPTGNFDWQDAVVRQGRVNSYSLSSSGGNDRTKFYVGGTYFNEKGFTIGNDINRLAGRINLEHDVNKRLKFGTNVSVTNTKSDRIGVENNTFAPLTSSSLQLPYVQPRDANGAYVNTGFIANIIAIEDLNINQFNSGRVIGNIFSEFKIINNLKIRTDWGIDNVQTEERTRSVNLLTPGGSASRTVQQDRKWLATTTLTYDKNFGDHGVNGLLGHSIENSDYDAIQVGATGFASDDLPNVASGSTPTTTFASRSAWALESYFGRFNYRYKNRYLFEASLRRDGSSRFGSDKRYGNFWAVSGGWIISDEDFFKGIRFINNLKLTTSYGTSGNDRIGGDFPSLGLYGGGVGADYSGAAGLSPTQIPNPSLQWEESKQWDIGLAASFFKSRINLNINVFNKRTVNNLVGVPLPFTTGFASVNQNIGEIENKGVDIELNTVNFKGRDFEWNTSLNVGFLKNTVLSLPSNKDEAGRDFLGISTAQRAIVGHSRNSFYLIRYVGVNPQTGNAEWLDKNGNVTLNPVAADRQIVGTAIPEFTGGFTNNFRYKGFDLTLFFNFAYGNKVLIDGLRFTENLGTGSFNKTTNVLNYWKKAGDNAFAPNLASSTAPIFNQLSTLQLQNGSYMRLKTISLGYRLSNSIIQKLKFISSARFYVLGQNLFIIQDKNFRGPDAEVSANGGGLTLGESFFALPQSRTLTFGLNIGF